MKKKRRNRKFSLKSLLNFGDPYSLRGKRIGNLSVGMSMGDDRWMAACDCGNFVARRSAELADPDFQMCNKCMEAS